MATENAGQGPVGGGGLQAFCGALQAQETYTVNFKDTDVEELIRFVAQATDKTIIVDPKVKGRVQVISSKPVTEEELYQLFLSILEVHGFAAVESGEVVRVIPSQDARTAPVVSISLGDPARFRIGEILRPVEPVPNAREVLAQENTRGDTGPPAKRRTQNAELGTHNPQRGTRPALEPGERRSASGPRRYGAAVPEQRPACTSTPPAPRRSSASARSARSSKGTS